MYTLHGDEFVLLEYEDWEWINDYACEHCPKDVMRLHNCTLHAPIGNFNVGDIVSYISFKMEQYSHSRVRLTDENRRILSQHCCKGCIQYDEEDKSIIAAGPAIRDSLLVSSWTWEEGNVDSY